MNAPLRLRLTPYACVVVFLVAMNMLMFVNVFLAGRTVSTLVLLPVVAALIVLTMRYFRAVLVAARPVVTPLDFVVSIYFFYSLGSIVLYFQPANPATIEAYLYGINAQVLPMLMYFGAKGIDSRDFKKVVKLLITLQVACAIVGIALFLLRPDFYSAYLQEKLGVYEDWEIYGRLQSYMGSTAIGILSAVSIVLLTNVSISRILRYALWLLLLFTIVLTQQRGAYVSGILASVFLLYRSKVSPLHLGTALLISLAAFLALLQYIDFTSELFLWILDNRIIDSLILGNPLGERAEAYRKGLEFLTEFPFGLGLGATTSAADDAGAHLGGQVVDAYYMRIACDLGLVGLVLFVMVLVFATFSAIRSRQIYGFSLIVVIYAIQSTGTNVLDSYYVSHVFWLLLGYVGTMSVGALVPSGGMGFSHGRAQEPSRAPAGKNGGIEVLGR